MIIEDTTNNVLLIMGLIIMAGIILFLFVSASLKRMQLERLKEAKELIKERHERISTVKWRISHEKAVSSSDFDFND